MGQVTCLFFDVFCFERFLYTYDMHACTSCSDRRTICNRIVLTIESLMRKYKSHELVDFKPRSLSSLKYDIDGMLPRSKSGHVVYCIFSRGSLLLITLHLPHLLGRGASQDTFLIKCLRFDCIRNFFEARSFKSFRQDVVYSQPGLRVRVATSDV